MPLQDCPARVGLVRSGEEAAAEQVELPVTVPALAVEAASAVLANISMYSRLPPLAGPSAIPRYPFLARSAAPGPVEPANILRRAKPVAPV